MLFQRPAGRSSSLSSRSLIVSATCALLQNATMVVASWFAVALLSPPPALAQATGAIRGRAIDASGEPARGAQATLLPLRRRVQVNAEGAFEFVSVPPGSYILELESPVQGNATVAVTVEAGKTVELEAKLDLLTHHEEVIVTASPELTSRLEVAAPVSVLEGEDLDLRRQATLGDTLAELPGITASQFAAGASRPIIRGMDGDRVRMLQDGVGSGDVSDTSHDHGVTIDPLSAERIEVIRGPATLLYGSSAIGGVVNVEDGRIPTFRLGERFGGAVEIGGGTVADDRNAAASLEGGGDVWAWHLGGYYRDADDYEIPGASAVDGAGEEGEEPAFDVLPNSDLQNGGGTVGFSRFFGDDGFAGLSYSRFDTEYGIPSEAAEGVRIEMERDRFDFRTEVMNEFGPFSGFRLRAGATDYEHTEFEGPEIGTVFLNDYWEGRAEVVQQERGRLSGAIGLQASDRKLEAVGAEAFIPSTDAEDLALFVFEELGWDAVKLQLGARYDTRDVTANAPDLPARDFDDVSASLGFVFLPIEGSSIAVSLARAVKFPSSEELYSNGLTSPPAPSRSATPTSTPRRASVSTSPSAAPPDGSPARSRCSVRTSTDSSFSVHRRRR